MEGEHCIDLLGRLRQGDGELLWGHHGDVGLCGKHT